MPRFGEWNTVRSIGEGGQGWTYLVHRASQPEEVFVLKRLKNAGRRERFEKEIAALERLSHPGIVKIVEHNSAGDHPYLVMEFCPAGDLSQVALGDVNRRGKLEVFRQICEAVAAAHEAGIIHRDLKPKNVLLREGLLPVVADFGLCMDVNDLENRPTETGEAVGPRNYIAPELEGGPTSDPQPASDCYSLGKLLYFLLAGRDVPRERHRDSRYNLVNDTAEPLVHFAYELLDRSICENPADRFKNASEFLVALEGVMERVDKSAHVLDLKVRQQCLYCIEGAYELRLIHERGARSPASPPFGAYEFWGDNETFKQKPWMILVCNVCGNVQMFRSDFASPGHWKNVPKVER